MGQEVHKVLEFPSGREISRSYTNTPLKLTLGAAILLGPLGVLLWLSQ